MQQIEKSMDLDMQAMNENRLAKDEYGRRLARKQSEHERLFMESGRLDQELSGTPAADGEQQPSPVDQDVLSRVQAQADAATDPVEKQRLTQMIATAQQRAGGQPQEPSVMTVEESNVAPAGTIYKDIYGNTRQKASVVSTAAPQGMGEMTMGNRTVTVGKVAPVTQPVPSSQGTGEMTIGKRTVTVGKAAPAKATPATQPAATPVATPTQTAPPVSPASVAETKRRTELMNESKKKSFDEAELVKFVGRGIVKRYWEMDEAVKAFGRKTAESIETLLDQPVKLVDWASRLGGREHRQFWAFMEKKAREEWVNEQLKKESTK